MTPHLEAAIAAIQPLSQTERHQLLQILLQSDSSSNSQTEFRTQLKQYLSNYVIIPVDQPLCQEWA